MSRSKHWLERVRPHVWLILSLLVLTTFYVLSNPSLSGIREPDTIDYLQVAADPGGEFELLARRSIVYPALFRLAILIAGEHWDRVVIAIQIGLALLMAGALFGALRAVLIPAPIASAGVVFTMMAPGVTLGVNTLLPELMLGYFAVTAWAVSASIVTSSSPLRRGALFALLAGAAAAAAALTKPIWLFGIIAVAGAILMLAQVSIRRRVLLAAVSGAAFFATFAVWQGVMVLSAGQFAFSSTGTVNFNLAAIRWGLTDRAAGTRLYDFYEDEALLNAALALRWNDDLYRPFTALKDRTPWEYRSDPEFRNAIIAHALPEFVLHQLSRFGAFFSTRPPTPFAPDSPIPAFLQNAHTLIYAVLWRPLMLPLMVFSLVDRADCEIRAPAPAPCLPVRAVQWAGPAHAHLPGFAFSAYAPVRRADHVLHSSDGELYRASRSRGSAAPATNDGTAPTGRIAPSLQGKCLALRHPGII
ncbi:MAG: hypothetical protein IPK19_23415 [Chloroflexi bacterium]|nr:hypothetical protein [Chloroflexota bacterium]